MVAATTAAKSVRRPTIRLSEPLLSDRTVVEPDDTPSNFHIPPARAGYSGPQGSEVQRKEGAWRATRKWRRRSGMSGRGGRKSATRRSARSPHGAVRVRAHARRDQPRHRGADRGRPGAGERVPAHARAVHGRHLSVSGQIRLRHRRAWSRPGRRSCSASKVFALHPHQTAVRRSGAGRRAGAGRHSAVARRARRQHGDRAERDLGRARPDPMAGSPWSAPAWSARWSPSSARASRTPR